MKTIIILCTSALILGGCMNGQYYDSRVTDGAIIGGTGGAIVGGVTSGTVGGVLVGAVAGAATGAVIADVTRPRYRRSGTNCYYSEARGREVCRIRRYR
jgi:hypothetical protein